MKWWKCLSQLQSALPSKRAKTREIEGERERERFCNDSDVSDGVHGWCIEASKVNRISQAEALPTAVCSGLNERNGPSDCSYCKVIDISCDCCVAYTACNRLSRRHLLLLPFSLPWVTVLLTAMCTRHIGAKPTSHTLSCLYVKGPLVPCQTWPYRRLRTWSFISFCNGLCRLTVILPTVYLHWTIWEKAGHWLSSLSGQVSIKR